MYKSLVFGDEFNCLWRLQWHNTKLNLFKIKLKSKFKWKAKLQKLELHNIKMQLHNNDKQ